MFTPSKIAKWLYKPGSVLPLLCCHKNGIDDHSSGHTVASSLKQPTRSHARAALNDFLFGLAADGVYLCLSLSPAQAVCSYHTISPLPHHLDKAVYSLWHFPKVSLTGSYPASCSIQPGLSSLYPNDKARSSEPLRWASLIIIFNKYEYRYFE